MRYAGVVALVCIALAMADTGIAQSYVARPLSIPAAGTSIVVDESAQRLFIAMPTENRVLEVSMVGNMDVVRQIPTGFRPTRLALSVDGRYLYTTLGTSGSFTRFDRDGNTPAEETVIASQLDHASTYDIVAGIGDEVFVSANPYSSGFAYIVRVNTMTGAAVRVASNRIIRAAPVFAIDRAAGYLYVGEGFSPNSIYKLDIALPEAPIVAEDQHGSVSGAFSLDLNPSGTRLVTGVGQLIRTQDITQAALLNNGVGAFSKDGKVIGIFNAGVLSRYDATSLDTLPAINASGCGSFLTLPHMKALQRGGGWILLSQTSLCKIEDSDYVFATEFD